MVTLRHQCHATVPRRYASWFIQFKGFSNSPYPGGTSKAAQDLNASFAAGSPGAVHVPPCDWYNNGTAPRCSGFYHDQDQSPNHAIVGTKGSAAKAYPADGICTGQCDCGATNPCGEYIFDHRGGAVDGQTFTDWFVNECKCMLAMQSPCSWRRLNSLSLTSPPLSLAPTRMTARV
jgi:hypothetical protein